ncbi:MAG: AAA family ATPase [Oscillospiraceae bacterium]|nr:AAA family ATPase [Oscillospiraceae bacterium]
MRINKLFLKNFRGYAEREFSFHDRLTVVCGENGSGKTSLLEGLSVALGGWLSGFDGLDRYDHRNIIKADRRAIIAQVNSAILEQVPVEVSCDVMLANGEGISWSRALLSLNGRTTTGGLSKIRKITEEYNGKIYAGEDDNVVLPLVAYYSAARLWNNPVYKERSARKDDVRLNGYKGAISFSDSIKDTLEFIDRLAYFAYREDDPGALAEMNAILGAIVTCLNSAGAGGRTGADDRTGSIGSDDPIGTNNGIGADDPIGTNNGMGADDPIGTNNGIGADDPIGTNNGIGADDHAESEGADDRINARDRTDTEGADDRAGTDDRIGVDDRVGAKESPDVHYSMKAAEFCVVTHGGEIMPYSLLSDGYRCATSLIIDICRRILALNPQLGEKAIKEVSGVVLIDDIELHLHPKWQAKVLGDLLAIFPRLQFIVTTHAPAVIQSVSEDNLMIL